jgi:hypothetical protein
MRLYRVEVTRTLFVVAETDRDAERAAEQADENPFENQVHASPVRPGDPCSEWEPDSLVYGPLQDLRLEAAIREYVAP